MKLSVFAGVVTLFSGVMAIPHASSDVVAAELVKRSDLSSYITNLQTQVNQVVDQSNAIDGLVDKAARGDFSLLPNITAGLHFINKTLTSIEDVFLNIDQSLHLRFLIPIAKDEKNIIFDVFHAFATILNSLTLGIFDGTKDTTVSGRATTDISALGAVTDVTSIFSLLSKLASSVSSTISKITSAIHLGKLGSTDINLDSNGPVSISASEGDIGDLLKATMTALNTLLQI